MGLKVEVQELMSLRASELFPNLRSRVSSKAEKLNWSIGVSQRQGSKDGKATSHQKGGCGGPPRCIPSIIFNIVDAKSPDASRP